MGISDKTRKLLWGRSGNRCAICRCVLIMDGDQSSASTDSVVGDECHIVSNKPQGPRHNESFPSDPDGYDNLILLCKTHHKLVDNQPSKYTVEALQNIKKNHEEWVHRTLGVAVLQQKAKQDQDREQVLLLTFRIRSGKEALRVTSGVCGFDFDYDELTQDEADVVASFLQNLQDWGDIWDEVEISERIHAELAINQDLTSLEKMGFVVFGARHQHKMIIRGHQVDWPMAVIRVLRSDNPQIVDLTKLTSQELR